MQEPKQKEWKTGYFEGPSSNPDVNTSCSPPCSIAESPELRKMVQYLISTIGYPVGMGMTITDKQTDIIIELIREYDKKQ